MCSACLMKNRASGIFPILLRHPTLFKPLVHDAALHQVAQEIQVLFRCGRCGLHSVRGSGDRPSGRFR